MAFIWVEHLLALLYLGTATDYGSVKKDKDTKSYGDHFAISNSSYHATAKPSSAACECVKLTHAAYPELVLLRHSITACGSLA